MSRVASKLKELGLALPPPMRAQGGIALPFRWVSLRADGAIISNAGSGP